MPVVPLLLTSAANAFRVMTGSTGAIDWYHLVPARFTAVSHRSLVRQIKIVYLVVNTDVYYTMNRLYL